MTGWLAEARDRLPALLELGPQLGLDVRPHRSLAPCPVCGAKRQHEREGRDRRGPLGVDSTGKLWHCRSCRDVGGDALDLIALVRLGRRVRDLDGDQRAALRRYLADEGYCTGGRERSTVALRPIAPPPAPEPPKPPPPAEEVMVLWSRCTSVERDPEVARYLRLRGIDPWVVVGRDLARALPRDRLPSWAGVLAGSWASTGHRLALPMVDATGEFRSIHVRSVDPRATRKALSPTGYGIAGLVLADVWARIALRGQGGAQEWWVCEGPVDYLSLGTCAYARRLRPALLAVLAGSWTQGHADRVQDGAIVRIATHADRAGEGYAATVAATLVGRAVTVIRTSPPSARLSIVREVAA